MGKSEVCIAERRPFRYSFVMRKLMMLAGILSLMVGCATAPRERTITWDVLKWKGADPATAPLIDKSDVVLRGQDARTKRTYAVPLTVDLDVLLEKRETNTGGFGLMFVPTDQITDSDPDRFIAATIQYDETAYALIVEERVRKSPALEEKTLLHEQFKLKVGTPYHVKCQVTQSGLRITIDGQVYEAKRATVPYDNFRIQLTGWQPANRWRIRNFVIR
jgi:hypothetical protein